MKKLIIGGIVSGIILFVWQSLSWTALNIHGSQTQFTAAQTDILQALADANLMEGQYFVPTLDPANPISNEEYYSRYVGKPWATINYHESMENTMTMNMIRGFTADLFVAFLLCFVLLKNPSLNFGNVFLTCIAIGIISYITIPYMNSIWFQGNSIPDLIDAIVQWSLVGGFLGWLLPNKK